MADKGGDFFILNVPVGTYTLEVSCVGYQSKQIQNVIIEIDKTTRLSLVLSETVIEIEPIIVIRERPFLQKEEVSAIYIVRREEIAYMPIDYALGIVAFQPSVVRFSNAIHVRGGRATEVLYMIDNVSIIDPQTGDMAIHLSKGIIDEVIFFPGSFDAEYGRAMSGVINMITTRPLDQFRPQLYGKTEKIMPYYYDFGYENYQSSIHVPLARQLRGFVSIDLMHADDWDPKLFILPHKQRDDYSLYGKLLFTPLSNMTVTLSGAQSRSQFDRYDTRWKFIVDNYRSDLRQGNLQALNISYLPNSMSLFNATLSRLYTRRKYGVRQSGSYGLFDDFSFVDYTTLRWSSGGFKNAYGVSYPDFYIIGDYPEYQDKTSQIYKITASTDLHLSNYYEIKAGLEYVFFDFENFAYFVSDTAYQLIDEYQYRPKEHSFFVQHNLDYKIFYIKIGGRFDYFSAIIDTLESNTIFSPRVGFSCMITDKLLLRINYGQYVQPPLYDQMYGYYGLLPFPEYITDVPIIGNPTLVPEKTKSYEIGILGELSHNLAATINAYYKDVSDLVGTRLIVATPHDYYSYFNVEYANIKGIETVLEFHNAIFTGKFSYTLSYARGTSSYAEEYTDTNFIPPATDYYLDFDQRHRIFLQGIINTPWQTKLHLFAYFGNGFPYTPPGPEGEYEGRNIEQLPFQRQIDCVLSRSFKIGRISLEATIEILNLLDARYEISPLLPFDSDVHMWEFSDYISITDEYYHPAADLNHDGLITPYEYFVVYKEINRESIDWVNCYTAPRRLRIGVTIHY
ncbi:hypothetical protein AMJ52_02535 [candidate division TA06 bacterium DG_78]|uniref:TonB-dependent receptor-like beta-barrel domain-containing protein n=1 Tax=candidate division TA06 bacterium DG_78 TaxID=1703772 RepID=A0A0S7YGY7_UNCT6|nr:MAG: hypothetical protein AMJ52_02535 [candidate division TA06 bacterium DG_78]